MCIKCHLPLIPTRPDLAKTACSKGRTQRLEAGATETKGSKSASQRTETGLTPHVSHTSFPNGSVYCPAPPVYISFVCIGCERRHISRSTFSS